ncbi:MAG: DUF3990 domain-containing protein [Salinivirgaceae bacterium]|nr:DUF3990 domain-containing protein [Salinivirgaceae bacterium]
MLKLYHGSNVRIERINLLVGHVNKDFGKGFYLTTLKEQAEAMANRKARLYIDAVPVVTEFNFDDSCLANNDLNIKIFEGVSEEWAEFIFENRRASETGYSHNYDIVIGPVADDGVVMQLDRYEMGKITLQQLVEELRFRKLNNQYYFGTEKAIKYLTVV